MINNSDKHTSFYQYYLDFFLKRRLTKNLRFLNAKEYIQKINVPHHAVNGTLYKAVRYRYNFTVIFPLKIEKKKVELIKIFFGLSIFFRSG